VGDGDADAALVLLTAQAATDAAGVARAVIGATRSWRIPVAAAFVGGARVAPGVRALEEAGIPCYPFPEPAVRTLAGMLRLRARRERRAEPAHPESRDATAIAAVAALSAGGPGVLGMSDLASALACYGIPVLPSQVAATGEDAAAAAERVGFPVALKLRSPDISHKTDVGGVRLGLATPAEVAAATGSMLARVAADRPTARIDGVLVQPMAPPGVELLLGMVRDAQFGPMVVVGFGGIHVEVLRDTAARLCPLDPREALDMLGELRMAPLLDGARGQPPVNKERLADTICGFARLAVDAAAAAELEVNPLVAGPGGVVAVDARARLT